VDEPPANPPELERLFQEARRLPEAERAAFLDRCCAGDPDLRARLEEMLLLEPTLRSDEAPTADSLDPAAEPVSHESLKGSVVADRYRILGVIGEGGFGVVYEAEQHKPVRRRVALKILKPGMDSKAVVARFQAEQQALAVMDHQSIARVLDAGQTDRGLSFFVMELVKGEPITEFCDKNRLTIPQRLGLLIEVAYAVQHAHSKGVIHRDIKPTNVLVAYDNEGHPRPKVIDFGIAKALNQPLTEQTVFTERGQPIGTPEYMSPEQVEAAGTDVDTRADIYSLGVLLYEILTGTRPLDLRRGAFDEIRRLIRETDPERPSTRLIRVLTKNDDPDMVSRIVRARRADPRWLTGILRRDLDWVVMKTLEKDRERRYDTASALAKDLRRYLDGEPVEAGRPSARYLIGKFVRRHRTAVAVSGVILVVVMVAVGSIGASLATAAAALRREAVAEQVAQAWSDRRLLRDARAKAARLWPPYPDTVEALERWMNEYAEPLLGRIEQHEQLVASILEQGVRTTAPATAGHDPELRRELETLRSRLSAMQEEHTRLTRAAGDTPDQVQRSKIERLATAIADLNDRESELREQLSGAEAWRFEDPAREWRYQAFSDLVDQLRSFKDPETGMVASVRERIRIAKRIEQQTIAGEDARDRWNEAIADIARLDIYKGLRIEPQIGLLPLRRDPDSGLWEFWHVLSGRQPIPQADPGALSNWDLNRETGIVLVLVPPGEYWMGAQSVDPAGINHDPHAQSSEAPVHPVEVGAFFISKYEMTQAQWQRLSGYNPSYYGPEYRRWQANDWTNPVERISWRDCVVQLRRWDLDLPTEEQWEYAARAGMRTPWWCGKQEQSIAESRAGNVADHWVDPTVPISWTTAPWNDGWALHAPAGQFAPNPYGLHDVIGNVWEWCRGIFGPYPGQDYTINDEFMVSPPRRVSRGGSYWDPPRDARTANRYEQTADYREQEMGVRPMRPLRARYNGAE